VLDDLKLIHQRDKSDAFGAAAKQWQQLTAEFDALPLPPMKDVENVVYAGMGDSALPARLIETWLQPTKPFLLLQKYNLPAFVGRQTLFIAVSYSGSTQEVLSALQQAEGRGANVVVITAGGQLAELAQSRGYPLLTLPKTQPRYVGFAATFAFAGLLASAGLGCPTDDLAAAARLLERAVKTWSPEVPTVRNEAKKLAQELMGRSLVVRSGPALWPAAHRWKSNFNQDAKQLAWLSTYPEFYYNELTGWSKQPVAKPYAVIELTGSFDNPLVQKAAAASRRLLSGRQPEPLTVVAQGETALQQLLWTMVYGDFVSLYLAILIGVDPSDHTLVDKFKQELKNE
jgi:glucose/mannose-6-phosphate isomerase